MKIDDRQDTSNHIPIPPVPTDPAYSVLYNAVVSLINLVNGKLSLGTGEDQTLGTNVIGFFQDVLTPATPNTDFVLYHRLGYIPQCTVKVAGVDYADIKRSNQAADEQTVTLQCNVASVTLKIWVF